MKGNKLGGNETKQQIIQESHAQPAAPPTRRQIQHLAVASSSSQGTKGPAAARGDAQAEGPGPPSAYATCIHAG